MSEKEEKKEEIGCSFCEKICGNSWCPWVKKQLEEKEENEGKRTN